MAEPHVLLSPGLRFLDAADTAEKSSGPVQHEARTRLVYSPLRLPHLQIRLRILFSKCESGSRAAASSQ